MLRKGRRSRPGLIAGGSLLLASLIAAALVAGRQSPQQQVSLPPPLVVDVVAISKAPVAFRVNAQGSVTPKVTTVLVSEVQGRIVEVAPAFVAGGMVRAGELLVRVEPDDYQIAVRAREAELAKARAALEEERARGRVAEREWQTIRADKVPELGLRKPQLAQELANVKYSEAALDKARRDLARTEIRAPYDALISARQVDLGQFVTVATALGTLLGTDVAEIRLPLTDAQLTTLALPAVFSADQSLPTVTIEATLNGQLQQWPARLVRSEGTVESTSRFSYVVAEVTDPYLRQGAVDGRQPLAFGRFVSARLIAVDQQTLVAIPRASLRDGNRIVVVDDASLLQLRPVEVAHADTDFAYLRTPLAAGERLVVTPLANPLPGTKVAVRGDPVVAKADADAKAVGPTP
ncbi:MAG: efflux RND transporter periplasmic adaptor subunit [Gammaproteobacteria bacterium]|nr:efflux RND transporter periplasmic adaptor subunit [Gammaproteobacteria bacterium]